MLRMIEAPVQSLWDEEPLVSHSGGVFTIVTINVWFGKLHQRLRYDALFRLLAQEQPDLVAFQECLPDRPELWLSDHFGLLAWIAALPSLRGVLDSPV